MCTPARLGSQASTPKSNGYTTIRSARISLILVCEFCTTKFFTIIWNLLQMVSRIKPVTRRVPGLPIRDCARGCNNSAQMCTQLSAIDVTTKTFFERLYLVLGMRKIAPWVKCPYAPTTPTIHCTTISRFVCNFFPQMTPHFFWSARFTK